MKNKRKAFTLIELLVVISIIAVLMSILMPALGKVKEMGKRAVCLSNQHQLALSWTLYAAENDDKIVNSNTCGVKENPAGSGQYEWVLTSHPGEPTWVGWADQTPWLPIQEATTSESAFGQTIEEQHMEIEHGLLFPYSANLEIYKCPTGRRGNERTYAIVDSMNGWPSGPVLKKTTQISRAGERLVFVDCGEETGASWTLVKGGMGWGDSIQSRHSGGTTFAFADGHSEHYKFVSENTKWLGEMSIYHLCNLDGNSDGPGPWGGGCEDNNGGSAFNEDFNWIHRGMWGSNYKARP